MPKNGEWINGRQYWNGTFSQPGVIHPESNQQGAGKPVSAEVNRQSDAAQGLQPGTIDRYLQEQRAQGGGGGIPGGGGAPAPIPFGTGTGVGFQAPEVLNLPKLYEQLYANSGIKDLEDDLSAKERQFIEAKGKINDNPFLSEGTRVGRVAKMETLYGERTANQRNQIATKKADIEMKLNLETKQFDINSAAAQQAMDRFNSLLSMGALDNASGEDIANITRSTGLSSQAIQSAVQAQRQKNVQTQVIQTDDGESIKATVINAQTGQVISSTVLAASKPTKGSGGGGGGRGGTDSLTPTQNRNAIATARKALTEIDAETNQDKRLTVQETQRALEMLMNASGVDFQTADSILSKEFQGMGFKKHGW